jgi:hypothetical protein
VLFWTLVGLGLFAALICTILVIAMLMATRDTNFD